MKLVDGASQTFFCYTRSPMRAMISAVFEFQRAPFLPACIICMFVQTTDISAFFYRRKKEIISEVAGAQARSNSDTSRGADMTWLINKWYGRLYLVLQVICLAATVSWVVKFRDNDREVEDSEISESWKLYGAPRPDGKPLPPDVYTHGVESVDRIRKHHIEHREEITVFYLLPNLALLVIFAVGLFVAKGFPSQKSRD